MCEMETPLVGDFGADNLGVSHVILFNRDTVCGGRVFRTVQFSLMVS